MERNIRRENLEAAIGELLCEQEEVHIDADTMRRYIYDTALELKDEKLLRMLYIRAKTLRTL